MPKTITGAIFPNMDFRLSKFSDITSPPDRPRLDYEVASYDIKHYSSRDVAPSKRIQPSGLC